MINNILHARETFILEMFVSLARENIQLENRNNSSPPVLTFLQRATEEQSLEPAGV